MKQESVRPFADKVAVSLSLLCALHCLALPVAIVTIPSLATSALADESFHAWLVLLVLPISVFALVLGCKKHRNGSVLAMGMLGLLVLVTVPVVGHEVLGEAWERGLTLLGASIIALSHVLNYRLCRSPACRPSEV